MKERGDGGRGGTKGDRWEGRTEKARDDRGREGRRKGHVKQRLV
jgi:hypothetical protein